MKWLKAGAGFDVAASAAGVSPRTALRWLREGERLRRLKVDSPSWEPRGGEVDLFRFAEAVDIARAEAELADIVAVGVAARDRKVDGRTVAGDWRAAAYRLDRRDRSKAATAHAAATGGPGVGYRMGGSDVDDDDNVNDEDIIEALASRLDELATRTAKQRQARR